MESSRRVSATNAEHDIIYNLLARIAEVTGTDETALTPPLANVLDVEALAQVLQSSDAELCVTFSYQQCTVEMHDDGSIDVTPMDGV